MSSGQHADSLKLSLRDLKRPGEKELPGAPIVRVENVEEVTPGLTGSGKKSMEAPKHHNQISPITHETENIKTTVTEEDDSAIKTPILDKMKGKVSEVGYKLSPNHAVHAKEEDPHRLRDSVM